MASSKHVPCLSVLAITMVMGCGEVDAPTADGAVADASLGVDASDTAADAAIADATRPDAMPPDAAAPDATPACTGTTVGGYCWHKGLVDQSCLVVCSSKGDYDPATVTYAGATSANDRTNVANCTAISVAFSASTFAPTIDNINETNDYGCVEEPVKARSELISVSATTATGDNPLAARFCACTF